MFICHGDYIISIYTNRVVLREEYGSDEQNVNEPLEQVGLTEAAKQESEKDSRVMQKQKK